MALSDLASLGSLASGVAVLISLVYLALQVRHAEKYQRAQISHSRATRGIDIQTNFSAPGIAEAVVRARKGATDLEEMELYLFNAYQTALFVHWEDSFYQHTDGLMSDRAFKTATNLMRAALTNVATRVVWRRSNSAFDANFRRFIDGLQAEASVAPFNLALDEWKAEVATELAAMRTSSIG
ncbi:MAG TPA: hypothetical protein VHS81_11000 [Caulobacteraceae bacterium]|jgi:hypothetical protein|nr:hypothetical protein [Caulobacteraceae bacterium]